MDIIYLYANSLYDYKNNIGGWGAVLVYGDHVKELCGIVHNSSQYGACLIAILEGLKALRKDGLNLEILSFSNSVISPLSNISKLSKKKEKETSSDSFNWRQIIDLLSKHSFTAEWLTKESDNPYSRRSIEIAGLYKKLKIK